MTPGRSGAGYVRRGGWGGARPGAGRPPSGARAGERHEPRTVIGPHHAVHVTARLAGASHGVVPAADVRRALERPLALALARPDFRIVHLAVRPTRVELIVEADDRIALARGMQGFQVSAARNINRITRRTGRVFVDRYRARILGRRIDVTAVLARLPRHARERLAVPVSALFEP